MRGDLIETFKILTNRIKLEPSKFFEHNQDDRTRGHHMKLKTKRASLLSRAKFFSHRVVAKWNKLPEEVVSATTVNDFKKKLDLNWAVVT